MSNPIDHPRDRNNVEVLGYDECLRLLASRQFGRVAYVDAGTPIILPVNYVTDGPWIVFRSPLGGKREAASRGQPMAFEVDDHVAVARTGWSVLVTGTAEVIEDPATIERFEGLGLETWAIGDDVDKAWIRLRADTVTGRRAA